MFDVGFVAAFFAGVVSFFAPCVVPLLPAYVGYVTGVSLKDLEEHGYSQYRKQMILSSIFYILGFALIFTILGTAAAGLGGIVRGNGRQIQIVGGIAMIIFGLEFAGVIHINLLGKERRFRIPSWAENLGYFRAFFIGVVFAVAWAPCVGAVLGSILALAAVSGTASTGALLLFTYSLGISIPFLIVSLTLASAPKYLHSMNKYVGILSKIAGFVLALLGVLLVSGWYGYVNTFLYGFYGWGEFLTGLL